jgi:GDP-L-fucose synthase
MQSHINVGFGGDIAIAELAQVVGEVVGYQGKISFDATKPDGAPRKWMDSSKIKGLGWSPKVNLECGIRFAYDHFRLPSL